MMLQSNEKATMDAKHIWLRQESFWVQHKFTQAGISFSNSHFNGKRPSVLGSVGSVGEQKIDFDEEKDLQGKIHDMR